jgi:AbiV family abortive infection protein
MTKPAENSDLTPKATMELFAAVLSNAEALASEAQLLLDARHASRAYALAHLAHEELAKCYGLLNIWLTQVLSTDSAPWQLFWKRWRHHGFKVQLALAGDVIRQWVAEQSKGQPTTDLQQLPPDMAARVSNLYWGIDSALPQHAELSRLREDALYVDIRNGVVITPTATITDQMAAQMVAAAKTNCTFMRSIAQIDPAKLIEIGQQPAMNDIQTAWRSASHRREPGGHD